MQGLKKIISILDKVGVFGRWTNIIGISALFLMIVLNFVDTIMDLVIFHRSIKGVTEITEIMMICGISPQKAHHINDMLSEAGITFVDGGIIGGPAWTPGETWLYLSGEEARQIAACFSAGPLEVSVIGKEIGKASALKICYAAYSKGTTALLTSILALAEVSGVRTELSTQWERNEPGFSEQAERRARGVTAKAWRFAGEMDEIAATYESVDLPGDRKSVV